jgi:hypothetical protein
MENFGYPWRMPFPAGISCDIFLLRFVILVAAHHDSRFFAEYPGIGKPAECTFGSLEIYKAAQTHGTVCGKYLYHVEIYYKLSVFRCFLLPHVPNWG